MKNCFIIVNYNDFKSTKHLVDNIIDYKIIDYILIVDNNSCDEEKENLKTIKNKKINIVFNDSNDGYSSAINIGAKYLIEKFGKCNFIVSNSDIVIFSEDDLIKMIEYLNYDKVGIVGPQILELGGIYRGCKSPSVLLDAMMNLSLFKIFLKRKIFYSNSHYENEVSYVDVINSCFFLISSEMLQKINFMDENVTLYYEDFILSSKVRNLGYMSLICNKIRVKHLYSVSVDKVIKKFDKFKMLKRSQYYFHTTYNDITKFERYILKASIYLSVCIRKISLLFRDKN